MALICIKQSNVLVSSIIVARILKQFFMRKFVFTGTVSSDTDDSRNSKGRDDNIFIPLYHFRLLRNMQAFICNFAF